MIARECAIVTRMATGDAELLELINQELLRRGGAGFVERYQELEHQWQGTSTAELYRMRRELQSATSGRTFTLAARTRRR